MLDPTFTAASVGTAILLMRQMLKWARPTRLRVKSLAANDLRDVADGAVVKLHGTTRMAERVLHDPVFGQRCLYWHALIVIEEWSNGYKVDVVQHGAGCDFDLWPEPDAERVRVRAGDGRVEFASEAHRRSTVLVPPLSPAMTELLAWLGNPHESTTPRLRRYRCVVRILAEAQRVAIVGRTRWLPDADARSVHGYRDGLLALSLEPADDGLHIDDDGPAAHTERDALRDD